MLVLPHCNNSVEFHRNLLEVSLVALLTVGKLWGQESTKLSLLKDIDTSNKRATVKKRQPWMVWWNWWGFNTPLRSFYKIWWSISINLRPLWPGILQAPLLCSLVTVKLFITPRPINLKTKREQGKDLESLQMLRNWHPFFFCYSLQTLIKYIIYNIGKINFSRVEQQG